MDASAADFPIRIIGGGIYVVFGACPINLSTFRYLYVSGLIFRVVPRAINCSKYPSAVAAVVKLYRGMKRREYRFQK